MEKNKSTMARATDMMVSAMEKLLSNEITADVATAVALNGRTIVEAAREATNLARVTGYIPVDGAFGTALKPLEPQVTKEALNAQKIRLDDGKEVKAIAPAKSSRWANKGEFV